MNSLPRAVTGWRPAAVTQRTIRAANDNSGRRVIVKLKPPLDITTAEIEVFGALLAELEAATANDNIASGGAA